MRIRSQLLDAEFAALEDLGPGSDGARSISTRIGKPYLVVWHMLECLEREGFVRGDWMADSLPGPRRTYSLTEAGRRAVGHA